MAAKKTPGVGSAKDLSRYAGLGMQFAVTLLLFTLAGIWLDAKLGWSPWLLIAGVLLGGSGAFYAILRAVPPAQGGRDANEPPRSDPPA
jgi:F0F1-type ATP synthase assembly protein I